MATLTRGYSFGSTEQVTNSKLHYLVDSGTVTSIVDADISNSAAIAYSKLSIGSAAINYSKLNLTDSIVNADINSAAAIADTKLATISTAGKVSGAALTSLSSTPSGAGVIPTANLGSGTANSGTILYGDQTYKTAPSSLSNILFAYNGAVDAAGTGGAFTGEVENSSITPSSASSSSYRFLVNVSNSYTAVWSTRITKTSGFNTVTILSRLWERSPGGANSNLKVDIGGQNNNVSIGTGVTTPTWASSFTIDISSLNNGTTYDVVAYLKDAAAAGGAHYCSNIIGIAS